MNKEDKYIVFQSNNVPAVDIAGTAVVKAIAKQYPDRKIIVTSNFPEIWLHNPSVYRVYKLGQTPYFYEDYVKDRDTTIFAHDPMKHSEYLNGKSHLMDVWCKMCGAKWDGEKPSLHFTQRESEVAQRMTASDKPLFFIQPYEMTGLVGPNNWSWTKDIPVSIANQIVHKVSLEGYTPVVIKNENQSPLNGAVNLNMNIRQTLAALQYAEKILGVDSFIQAAAVALGKKATVTWFATHPKQNGYEENENIVIPVNTEMKNKIDGYNLAFDMDGKMLGENLNVTHFYNADDIVEKILKS